MATTTTTPLYNKILLAYSGGLDTTTIIPWLKENYPQAEIIAYCANVGQLTPEESEAMQLRAKSTGANKLIVEDLTEVFITDYIYPTLKAHAIYEGDYLLGTSMARPLIGKRLAEVAVAEGADAICHGATGKGNDQVRFELAFKAFAPHLPIIAPWRIWSIASRDDAMAYLQERGIHLPFRVEQSYSRDENIWHLSHEGLDLENPAVAPDYAHILQLTTLLEATPNEAEIVSIGFEQGVPIAVNGKTLDPINLLKTLNALGSKHGVGLVDMVENRLVGMKSRGVYETPGGALLYKAHAQLEHLCLDRATYAYKQQIALQFAQLTYNGDWFSPLREALSAFVDSTQAVVTGEVKLKLYKGNIIPAGTTSPFSLYDEELASFSTGDLFNHADAAGFINLYGLSTQVRALKAQKRQALVGV